MLLSRLPFSAPGCLAGTHALVIRGRNEGAHHKPLRQTTGAKAAVEGYDVGGKTGTAEKNVNGRYVSNKLMSSFIGAFPMREPRYVVLAAFDEPNPTKESYGYATGGWTGAPAVGAVISQMAPLYGIRPDFEADGMMTKGMEIYLKEGKNVAALSSHR